MKRKIAIVLCTFLLAVPGQTIFAEAEPTAENSEAGELVGSTNMMTAPQLPLGTKVFGSIEEGTSVWYAFTTGATAGSTYNITCVKASSGWEMYGYLYDEYGTLLADPVTADSSGTPGTISTNELQPNTMYYVRLNNYNNIAGDYGLSIKSPDDSLAEAPAESEASYETDVIDIVSLSDSLGDDVDIDSLSDSELEALAETQNSILHDLQESFDDAGINVNIDESTGRVTMDNSILFDYDDATLSDVGKAYLDGFIDVYTSVVLNDTYSGAISYIQIEGHTDSDGSYEYNQTLSEKRAASVAEYCISRDGRLAEVITTKGRSYDDLVYNDDGTVNMTASRRVVFRFILDTTQN